EAGVAVDGGHGRDHHLRRRGAEADDDHADQQRRHAEVLGGGGGGIDEAVGAPYEQGETGHEGEEGEQHRDQDSAGGAAAMAASTLAHRWAGLMVPAMALVTPGWPSTFCRLARAGSAPAAARWPEARAFLISTPLRWARQ